MNIRKIFYLSSADLKIQPYTTDDIAKKMSPVNEDSMSLPRSFAVSVREICNEEGKAGKTQCGKEGNSK